MPQKYFKELLKQISPKLESNKKKIAKPYRPNLRTLNKLTSINTELIDFLSEFSPFNPELNIEPIEWKKLKKGTDLKIFFPISSLYLKKINELNDEAMIDLILLKWREGITNSIAANKESFLFSGNTQIEPSELVDIFLEPTIKLTKNILFNQTEPNPEEFILDIALNSARYSAYLNPYYQSKIKSHYEYIIQRKIYTPEHINQYKKSQFKIVDATLKEALENTNSKDSLEVLKHIESYLEFVDIPKKEIIEKSKEIFNLFIQDLNHLASALKEAELNHKNTIPGTPTEKSVLRQVRAANLRYNWLKQDLIKVLEIFSEL